MVETTHQSPAHPAPPHSHGPEHDAEHVAKHVKGYLLVGLALFICTGLTVALSYWDIGSRGNILLAMALATFKAGLVAAIFMHLKGERITIWRFLIFTAIFVTGLFMLTALHDSDPIMGTTYTAH